MPTTIPPARYQISRMYSSLPFRRLQDVLSHIVPNTSLARWEERNSTQLSRLYILNMSNGQKLLLSYAPSLSVRLLRHEASLLHSEALLIHFIASSARERPFSNNAFENGDQSTDLSRLTPKLLKHSSDNQELNYPYTIFEPVAGEPLSTIPTPLEEGEKRIVYKQLGTLARELTSMTSPTNSFGTVTEVLPDPFVTYTGRSETKGWKTWSEAFYSLLEGILRDGEDMAVLLPYEAIRVCYLRSASYLALILIPRLAILDVASETNIMVETDPVGEGRRLMGLRSWSQGIFGDPLISNCFDDPSQGFLEGWRDGGEEVIEDQEHAHIRMMLYRCFRAVGDIVTEYYRPNIESSERELLARRRLIAALADLEKVHMNNESP